MNRINHIIYYLLFTVILVTGCTEYNDPNADSKGALRLQVEVGSETRSGSAQTDLLSSCVINIYNNQGLIRKYTGTSAMPEELWLATGEYRVDVEAGEAVAASFNKKFWKGSKPFSISAGSTTTVPVTCTIGNSVVDIQFDYTIAENFGSTYQTLVAIDNNDASTSLTFNSGTAASLGYFFLPANKSTLEWTFSGTVKGAPFSKSGQIMGVEPAKKYTLKFRYTETPEEDNTGGLVFDIVVDKTTTDIDDKIDIEIESFTGATQVGISDVWSKHSTLRAFVEENIWGSSNIAFQYRKQGSTGWSTIAATRASANNYTAALTALTPETTYEYQVTIGGEARGDILTFKTEATPALPNSGFNDWSKAESNKYVSPFLTKETKWWDSGNSGSALASVLILDNDGTTKTEGSYSAKLMTKWINVNLIVMQITKLAAGNLFTGSFNGTVGTKGGKVNFGRPFTARPTKLKVSYKYNTSKINHIDSYPEGGAVTTSDDDTGHIYIALGTWTASEYGGTDQSPVQVNTTDKSTFFNPSSKDVIAYGELTKKGSTDANVNDGWVNAEITLDYKITDKIPTHIMIVCSSSKLGDYFTGSDSSVLWIDNMELVYE